MAEEPTEAETLRRLLREALGLLVEYGSDCDCGTRTDDVRDKAGDLLERCGRVVR